MAYLSSRFLSLYPDCTISFLGFGDKRVEAREGYVDHEQSLICRLDCGERDSVLRHLFSRLFSFSPCSPRIKYRVDYQPLFQERSPRSSSLLLFLSLWRERRSEWREWRKSSLIFHQTYFRMANLHRICYFDDYLFLFFLYLK